MKNELQKEAATTKDNIIEKSKEKRIMPNILIYPK